MKKTLCIFILLGSAVWGVLRFPPRPLQNVFIRGICHAVDQHTAYRLSVRSMHGGLFGVLRLERVLLIDKQTTRPLVSAASIDVRPAWRALLSRRLVIDSLTLHRPSVEYNTSPSLDSPSAATAGGTGIPFSIRHLAVRDGRLVLLGPRPEHRLLIESINAQGGLDGGTIQVKSLQAASGGGQLDAAGVVRIWPAVSVHLQGRTSELPLHRFALPWLSVPSGLMASYTGSLRYQWELSGWLLSGQGELNGGAGRLSLNLDHGRGPVTLEMRSRGLSGRLTSDLSIPGQTLNGSFQLAVRDLAELSPWIKGAAQWHGVLMGSGTVRGRWDDPAIRAHVSASSITSQGIRADAVTLQVSHQTRQKDSLRLELDGEKVCWSSGCAGAWDLENVHVGLTGRLTQAHVSAQARFANQSVARFEGPVRQKGNAWQMEWEQLELKPSGTEPIQARAGGFLEIESADTFAVRALELTQPEGRLSVSQLTVGPKRIHVQADAKNLQLESFARVLFPDQKISGLLQAQVRLEGSLSGPEGSLNLTLSSGSMAGVSIPEIQMKLHLEAPWIVIDGLEVKTGLLDQPLRGQGKVPWHLIDDQAPDLPMDVRVTAPSLNPGVIAMFWKDAILEPGGHLTFEGRLFGHYPQIRPVGHLSGIIPRLQSKELGLDLRDVQLEIHDEFDRLEILRLDGKLGKGRFEMTGKSQLPGLNFNLVARDFTLMKSKELEVEGHADLQLRGRVDAPEVSGTLELKKGIYSRPRKEKPGKKEAEAHSGAPPDIWIHTALAVAAKWSHGVWFREGLTNIETRADLWVRKDRGSSGVYLSGTLDLLRGTYDAYNKDFIVKSGQLLFTGPPDINPQLSIQTQYKVKDYTVDLMVTGTAQEPKLTPTCTPSLTEPECYSVIVAGRPSVDLTGASGEKGPNAASELAAGMVSSYLTQELKSSGMNYLSLDVIRVQPTDKGSVLTVGRYLGSNLFVSYSQNPSDTSSNVVNAEYTLTSDPQLSLVGQTGSQSDNYMDLQIRLPVKRKKPASVEVPIPSTSTLKIQ